MILILSILVLIMCIEATTNILSKSLLFQPVKKYLSNFNSSRGCKFLHDLLDCPYCTSVWVSMFYTIMFVIFLNNLLPSILLWFFISIALHRASNIAHYIIDRLDEYHTIIPEE